MPSCPSTKIQLLFLDFDGVLHPRFIGGELFTARELFEDVLRQVPHVEVVISSSWRERHALEALKVHFSPDLRPRIVGVTPLPGIDRDLVPVDLHDFHRHAECAAWLARWRPSGARWLAVDDESEEFAPGCANLFVVDGDVGLEEESAQELLRRLRS